MLLRRIKKVMFEVEFDRNLIKRRNKYTKTEYPNTPLKSDDNYESISALTL